MQFEYVSLLYVMVDNEKGFEQFENVQEDVTQCRLRCRVSGKLRHSYGQVIYRPFNKKVTEFRWPRLISRSCFPLFCIYAAW